MKTQVFHQIPILLILLHFCWCHNVQSQAEEILCLWLNNTEAPGIAPDFYKDQNWTDDEEPVFVKFYVHVVRTSESTGGLTTEQVDQAISIMRNDFKDAGIYFIWDCNLLFVDETIHYNDYTGDVSVYEFDPHSDGVDIYFYPQIPSEEDEGFGASQCISTGSAMYIAGNFSYEPHLPYYTTSVVSHEMGHCLGLFHTNECTGSGGHLNCKMEHVARDGMDANCTEAGDYLCDTDADPDMAFLVDPETCTWDGLVPDLGTYFDPDETNIMGRTNPVCMQSFSLGQNKMMRKFAKFHEDVSLNVFQFEIENLEITENTTWTTSSFPNGEATVEEGITVKAGKHLIISEGVVVRFSPLANLIIEPGARLTLNGTLTSFCGTSWKGIEVWGVSDQSQYVIGGQIYQGQVFTSSTALIENAEIGIYVSGPDVVNETGGIVVCNGTTFRNNTHSVFFPTYQNFYPGGFGNILKDNVSFFRNCIFEINDQYPVEKPFKEFAKLSGVDGIKFETCSFKNEMTTPQAYWRDYGVGIRAADATFHVNRLCRPDVSPCSLQDQTVFDGIAYGIYNAGILGNKPYTVKNTEFKDCYMGIYQNQADGAAILVNRFSLGTVPDESLMTEQFGIFIEGLTLGMDLEENNFTATTGSADKVFGIYSQHLGTFDNVIRRNTFSGINFANVAEGSNKTEAEGLYYECNVNILGTDYDFSVLDDPEFQDPEGIRPIQGITNSTNGLNLNGAGNTFYHTAILQESDFFNDANTSMKYLYGPSTNKEPLFYTTSIISKALTNDNQCSLNYCIEQCKSGSQLTTISNNYNAAYTSYASLSSSLYNTNGSINTVVQAKLTSLKATMDEAVRLQIQHVLYDTIGRDLVNLRSWLVKGRIYDSDILKANSFAAEKSWTGALNHLAALPSAYNLTGNILAEHNRYTSIISLLQNAYNNGRSVDILNSTELITLDSIRKHSFGIAKRTSGNILTLYDSISLFSFHIPGGTIQVRGSTNDGSNKNNPELVTVHPSVLTN